MIEKNTELKPQFQKENYPELMRIVNQIGHENAFQRKRIEAFMGFQDPEYWQFAEDLSARLNQSLLSGEKDFRDATQSYNRMCMDFLREQIRFKKTGAYHVVDASAAERDVYSQRDVMRYYMKGLLLSYMFWKNHYAMFRFLREHLKTISVDKYLEVGCGHGLFTAEVMRNFPGIRPTILDISETSIEIAKEMLTTFKADPKIVDFIHGDYLNVDLPKESFDFIVMGEVIEHVNDAPGFLARTRNLLKPGGSIFFTTCANCPAIDHVYHFHNVQEIRDLVTSQGLTILKDMALASEDFPEEKWEEELVTVNYFAILSVPELPHPR
jgi:2-polyprenyl-3-methyl-5-hydroxy-6-metoxy-1,4-benzoquinol methylase